MITISAPENTREGSDLSEERRQALEERSKPLRRRTMAMAVPWVICEYPVNATAQAAGMSLVEMEEFVFGAVLLDWDAEAEKMRRIAEVFDAATEVRVEGDDTDLTLSLAGRRGAVDDGHINMPGGEVFYSPVEDSAEGVITFSEFPAVRYGRDVEGARLVFERGCIVEATARSGEAFAARDDRHRPGRPPPRRARHRLQPGDPALHEERRLRREDRRHDPPRGRQLVLVHRRQEQEPRRQGDDLDDADSPLPKGRGRSTRSSAIGAGGTQIDHDLGLLALDCGDWPCAREYLEAGLAGGRAFGLDLQTGNSVRDLAFSALYEGREDDAVPLFAECLRARGEPAGGSTSPIASWGIGGAAAARGDAETAACLFGAAEGVEEQASCVRRRAYEQRARRVRSASPSRRSRRPGRRGGR